MPKATGTRVVSWRFKQGATKNKTKRQRPTRAELGVDKHQSAMLAKLAEIPEKTSRGVERGKVVLKAGSAKLVEAVESGRLSLGKAEQIQPSVMPAEKSESESWVSS